MKSLNTYIKENTIKYTNYLGDCTFDEFMHINNFNENTITAAGNGSSKIPIFDNPKNTIYNCTKSGVPRKIQI